MRELHLNEPLSWDESLRSPKGRFKVSYDPEGVAVLTEHRTGEVWWRAGEGKRAAVGRLLLGDGGAVQVVDSANKTVWLSEIAVPGARSLTVTDGGDFVLCDGHGMPLFNSRTGPTGAVAMEDAAPAADITAQRYLVREGKWRQLVTRDSDGSLRISAQDPGGSGWSRPLAGPLVRWLEQDGTVLTWRLLNKKWSLCLVGADGELIWQEGMRNVPMTLPPPAAEHAYGGPELGLGGRLRHQSLTSPSGAYTLVHQEDGNLVFYDNRTQQAIWASDTWWAGDGWAELAEDGELVIRNLYGAPVWQSGTAGRGVERLVVGDFGGAALLDAAGSEVWGFRASRDATGTEGTADTTARGSVLRRGQTLRRQSLTSAGGGTVLAHGNDERLVLYGEDGRWIWVGCTWNAGRSYLVLDDDGVLRVRAEDGTVAEELGGPGEELVVLPGEVQLRRDDGTVVWRNGQRVAPPEPGASPPEDFTSWAKTLIDIDDGDYGVSVVHDVAPDEALRRLGVEPTQIMTGTWEELQEDAARQDLTLDEGVIAAFALGPHSLLVQDRLGGSAVDCPELSEGTFAVSCALRYLDRYFVVHRDGETVADHNTFDGSQEPSTPEVQRALAAMGSDNVIETVQEHDVELLCRTAGVRPTEADVAGTALGAILRWKR
ncbi:DUF6461 domain-containing protein [Streptomyces sp. 3N207]|uniref:DUF6461 domain-containing protein n=1 Tax=Streptomyces sp. 3N207 TaxID=3457417 RepID=UPI003FD2EA9F